jgi:hypothetical protein
MDDDMNSRQACGGATVKQRLGIMRVNHIDIPLAKKVRHSQHHTWS